MRRFAVVLLVLASAAAHAEPSVKIDLTAERRDFERKDQSRKIGLGFLAGTAAAGLVAIYGYSSASSARAQLESQSVPVNVSERTRLVQQGQGQR